jgi:acetoin utilization deacetylase AcuC-like enzyme
MQAFHFDQQRLELPAGHRFPQHKYAALRERIASELPGVRLQQAPAAAVSDLTRVHAPEYVHKVMVGGLSAAEQREIGFPWNPGMPVRARHSVGATLAATHAALQEGVAMNLGGGTHHASRDAGGGFCVFNDVACAAQKALDERRAARVLVVDLDVHQGNGTACLFAGRQDVFTLSLHGAKNFPFRKVPSHLDIDLPDDCGDAAYLDALQQALRTVSQRFGAPDLAYYLAGADPHEGDRLGRLRLTAAAMAERDQRVFEHLTGVPVVMLMAGGYPTDLDAMLSVQVSSARMAYRFWQAAKMSLHD